MISRWLFLVSAVTVGVVGCGSPVAEFRRYDTFAHKTAASISEDYSYTPQQRQDIDDALAALFGSPDHVVTPAVEGSSDLFSQDHLQLAAGPVGSDEAGRPRGLYREHCAHCHGVTGDGVGPTASFLNPYPRDYRPGKFKFKSTPIGQRPTHEDLLRIVTNGIPGTAMPSFALLPAPELEALVEYVKYLSVRGEVTRQLLYETAQLGDGERLFELDSKDPARQQEQLDLIKGIATDAVAKWNSAVEKQTPIPERPEYASAEDLAKSVKHGRELFFGTIANCVKCHGETQLGDGQTTDYDEWSKEFTEGKPEKFAEYEALGMLPPRHALPRNLRQGVFRGGMRPIDIFWRVRNGIEGTPMPAATLKPEGDENAKGLTIDEVWDLVNYVQSLQYDAMSNPAMDVPENLRERS
jgi:mono/diheme cytochrome c family protein